MEFLVLYCAEIPPLLAFSGYKKTTWLHNQFPQCCSGYSGFTKSTVLSTKWRYSLTNLRKFAVFICNIQVKRWQEKKKKMSGQAAHVAIRTENKIRRIRKKIIYRIQIEFNFYRFLQTDKNCKFLCSKTKSFSNRQC